MENNDINHKNEEKPILLLDSNKDKTNKNNSQINNINNTIDIQSKEDSNKNINNINIINEDKKENVKKDYFLEVKNYLNPEEQNKEYIETINNNPEKLFELINDRNLILWQSVIYNCETTIIDCDADLLTAVPQRKDQQIIVNDSNRTRFKESILIPGFKKILEEILTFYCNTKGIKYKQGLNEIFGPLILMRYKIKTLKLTTLFNFGEAFIDRFLPSYYYEKELYSLRSSISLFVHLLKYHEPCIFNYLDSIEIPHELYATNWLLTLRSQKLKLDILYNLWDYIIKINDPLFIHFILVALIKYKRELLINCDSNNLLKLMVGLNITSKEELDSIIKIALELRNNTPYSYRLLVNKIGFLKLNNKNIKNNFDKYKPESILSFQTFPIEILYAHYNNIIMCPDPDCANNLNKKIINLDNVDNKFRDFNTKDINDKNHICEKCNMKIEKNLNYIILDLRLFPPSYFQEDDDFFKMGFVSGMVTIDKEELKLDNIDTLLSSKLLSIRGKNHIVLMTSTTDYFFDFEKKYYSDVRSEIMKKKILFGVVESQKQEKILNLEDAEKNLDLKEIYKLKEYDNLRKIMISMKKNNFPYVSYLEGGFDALHRESLYYNIELVNHKIKECKLCKKKEKETLEEKKYKRLNTEDKISNISNILWKNDKIITEKELNSFFSNENNIVLVCNMNKYKTKYFHKNEIEIFIAILYDKKIIEIYKNDFKKEKSNNKYNIDNINYYNLGLKDEQKRGNFMLRLFEIIQFEDIEKINYKNNNSNIMFLHIKNKNEKSKMKLDNSYEIVFEFHSMQDSKAFRKAIKKLKKG